MRKISNNMPLSRKSFINIEMIYNLIQSDFELFKSLPVTLIQVEDSEEEYLVLTPDFNIKIGYSLDDDNLPFWECYDIHTLGRLKDVELRDLYNTLVSLILTYK